MFGVCFVIVPIAHSIAFCVHRLKHNLLRRDYFKLYSSDDGLATMCEKVPIDGFKPQNKNYESDKFDTIGTAQMF